MKIYLVFSSNTAETHVDFIPQIQCWLFFEKKFSNLFKNESLSVFIRAEDLWIINFELLERQMGKLN